MQGVVLEEKGTIRIREIEIPETLGPRDVRIQPRAVGICGSDLHYYLEGRIGDFVVDAPMVLGHEASGVVTEVGEDAGHLAVGDRVCMEPGIPNFQSPQALAGRYNLDPGVRFWATPPVHGCLRETVVHPANLTFRIPDTMSFEEGALAEPAAVGVYSVERSGLSPGGTAVVIGAGTIGIVTALAADAAGCGKIYITDVKQDKLDFVDSRFGDRITTVNLNRRNAADVLADDGLPGADAVFEASGSPAAYGNITDLSVPGGALVLIGMPPDSVMMDVVALQVKEIRVEPIFRYVNAFPKTVSLIASGKLRVSPLVTKRYPMKNAVDAFEYAAGGPPSEVKVMIDTS